MLTKNASERLRSFPYDDTRQPTGDHGPCHIAPRLRVPHTNLQVIGSCVHHQVMTFDPDPGTVSLMKEVERGGRAGDS